MNILSDDVKILIRKLAIPASVFTGSIKRVPEDIT